MGLMLIGVCVGGWYDGGVFVLSVKFLGDLGVGVVRV